MLQAIKKFFADPKVQAALATAATVIVGVLAEKLDNDASKVR